MNEKIVELIDKLQKLKNENASIEDVLYCTKSLYQNLQRLNTATDSSTKKVSVILPEFYSSGNNFTTEQKATLTEPEQTKTQQPEPPVEAEKTGAPKETKEEPARAQEVVKRQETLPLPSLFGKEEVKAEPKESKKTEPVPVPHHKEINDIIAGSGLSLNDRLKIEREEIAGRLGNASVKDLAQAIGLNQKFGFINELFRGDQSLYNRSIQTINGCSDYDEAMYWITRELKIKLGWQDNNKTVQQFYALVRKRFS